MNAEQALIDLFRQWRRLARAGTVAIQKCDWQFLLECQGAVRCLQTSITRLRSELRIEWEQSQVDHSTREKELTGLVQETMEIVEANKQLLSAARQTARVEREKLALAGRNLRRLRESYHRTLSSRWTSFS